VIRIVKIQEKILFSGFKSLYPFQNGGNNVKFCKIQIFLVYFFENQVFMSYSSSKCNFMLDTTLLYMFHLILHS